MPDQKQFATRVEELLREQLEDLGENPSELSPHEITVNMHCEVWPDKSMVYSWKDIPLLRVVPEPGPQGTIWRMFTRGEEDL